MIAAPICSGSRRRSGSPWPSWLGDAPHLVAEALSPVPDPLAAWLQPGPPAPPQGVAAALARALLPPEASDVVPSWLRADQRLSFARALAAVRRHGGALLADGVGTGKTFIGLAVGSVLEPGRPLHVLAPAALLTQWRAAAERAGLEILTHSHETLSRGRCPPALAGPVIIDESHRLRTPATRRYQALAPWCVGRRGLLLSATPVVNRLEDLSHQLLLLVRDDELGWAGVASLSRLERGTPPAGLAELVITGEDRSGALPESITRDLRVFEPDGTPFEALRTGIAGLRLSSDGGIAGLLRGTLLVALASSPLALADALGRYRSLLQHARDAAAAGRSVSRQTIRRIVGAEAEQLVLWPLVAETSRTPELALEDLADVQALEAAARAWGAAPDAKLQALRQALRDGKPTLVFTAATATVKYLRGMLGSRIAWCTGLASGVDSMTLPREDVLDWFRKPAREKAEPIARPRLLIATDVAAEGLDLPLVERVVHYDLPWTAVRLEQRAGRALRLGSRHRQVEVLRLLPAPVLEAALRQQAILQSKSGLPAALGLGREAGAPWRRKAQVALRWGGIAAQHGVAVSEGDAAAIVAGFRIVMSDGSARESVQARTGDGWTDDVALVAALLETAHEVTRVRPPRRGTLRAALRAAAVPVRAALLCLHGARLASGCRAATARRALRRVVTLAQAAARRRDGEEIALLERGLRLLRRGHTSGEARLVERMAALSPDALLASFARLPAEPPVPQVTRVELFGVLLVERRSRPG